MNMPLVSVVVPCYNHENFIEECLNSIYFQNYSNIELIVIDDGSTDQSYLRIEALSSKLKDRFTRFVSFTRSNKGACETINEGISLCLGKYTIIFGSDDVMEFGRVSYQVSILECDEFLKASFGSSKIIDDKGKILGIKKQRPKILDYNTILYNKASLQAPTMMINTEALKEIGIIPKNIIIEDRFIQLSLTKLHARSIHVTDRILCSYRVHSSNQSSNIEFLHDKNIELLNFIEKDNDKRSLAIAMNKLGCAISIAAIDKKKSVRLIMQAIEVSRLSVFNFKFVHALLKVLL
ncbi:glycosyltransferase family 2 protein [Vibrio sp. IRLE0018]|uniref:glycosyltransferase family 2 protein n=1 Tax=Vibrio floridensis TaxID=2908007 RepID=UPI001F2B1359|nr:glycosyltransferase family A protein [Vibrio floridensis]MCF8780303.1 glycosyltransferase family 2 protein [Vibrio floridensis]